MSRTRIRISWLGACLFSLLSNTSLAGLAASDVVVAVNGSSLSSRTLANHYVALRRIPPRNVVVLDRVPQSEIIPVTKFRDTILRPLLAEVDRRGLAGHVQCITYSADFPTGIDISSDLKPLGEIPKVFTPRGSINGLTYLWSHVLASDPTYIAFTANAYARRPLEASFSNPSGALTSEAWNDIQAHIRAGEHEAAGGLLADLFSRQPHQFPLAYMAAAEMAQTDQPLAALPLLRLAIAAGWTAGDYLRADERFQSVRDEPEFQTLEAGLGSSAGGFQAAVGFDARQTWAPNGIQSPDPALGHRYLLSTVLGVTRGCGTTLQEAIDSLERSVTADFTHPSGTFFFSKTANVRTRSREAGFAAAIQSLKTMGFAAELITTILPENKPRILGAQFGTPSFDWSGCGSSLVPGAIADNLTSFGGAMAAPGRQTKLTELIRAGAAGSSGTVTEPFVITQPGLTWQPKFPQPQLYVHYAAGATLAEAFYLSVTCPYQLLVVGDPLCKPFSHAPRPAVDLQLRRLNSGESVPLTFDSQASSYEAWLADPTSLSKKTTPLPPSAMEILIDGTSPKAVRVQPSVAIKIDDQTAGYHELSLRFVAADPLSQRFDCQLPIWLGEPGSITLGLAAAAAVDDPAAAAAAVKPGSDFALVSPLERPIRVVVEAVQASRVTLWHDWEQIALAVGSRGTFTVPLRATGMGPVRLYAKAELEDGSSICSRPLVIDIRP